MKNLSIGLALSMAVSAPVSAAVDEFCAWVGKEAAWAMTGRQVGMPIGTMMALTDNPTLRRIVLDAYAQPAMGTPEDEENQRVEFGIKWALFCIKNR